MQFEEVSRSAGIDRTVQTAGSSWGDLNADGWPDLWVSNHDLNEPSLYLNQQDGTFVDVISTAVVGEHSADFHGSAWADYDNDGDQDLFVISGGGYGRGFSPNYFFLNEEGKLRNIAEKFGLDYPYGRGRTPLWFDADRDGKLDLLLMNRGRAKGKWPSAIFRQKNDGFASSNDKFGFNPSGVRTNSEVFFDFVSNAVHFRMRKGPGKITSSEVFAQLSDIDGDGHLEVLSYVKPMRIFSTRKIPYDDITNDLELPSLRSVQDAAVEDFNGDGLMDMFLAMSSLGSDVVQLSPYRILGCVKRGTLSKPNEVRFRSNGKMVFTFDMHWLDPTDPKNKPPMVLAGDLAPVPADGTPMNLSPDDPAVHKTVTLPDRSVSIHYDPDAKVWTIRVAYPEINFTAFSDAPISRIGVNGFKTSKGGKPDALLLAGEGGLRKAPQAGISSRATACGSVAAGDFDNDMDVDLYLVCREPVENASNILYENDGTGQFTEIHGAGGAAGSDEGRGAQVSVGDYDRDGFLDLFVTNGIGNPPFSIGPHQLFRNAGNGNHWLEIDLQGTKSNRDGIGAVVALETGGKKQIRIQDGGIHSFSQDHQRIHFGLGENAVVDKLTVRWPNGGVQELKAVKADQILQIVEPDDEGAS